MKTRLYSAGFYFSFLFPGFLVLLPFLLGLKDFGAPDFNETYLPWLDFLRTRFLQGEFPLWNSYAMLGRPVWGETENSLLYPLHWLLLLSPRYTVILYIWVHLSLLQAGGYFLGRSFGLTKEAAWVSGLLIAFNGWVSLHLFGTHIYILGALTWIPWILGFLLKASDKKDFKTWMGPLFFASIFALGAGSPQIALYGFYFTLLFLLVFRPRVFRQKHFWVYGVLVLFSALLYLSPQLISLWVLKSQSTRSGVYPAEAAKLFSFAWKDFLDLFWFHELSPKYEADVVETGIFMGPISLLIILLGIRWVPKRKSLGLLSLFALFFLLAAAAPLIHEAFRIFPGLSSFRSPGRWMIFGIFCLALLVGFCWQELNFRNPILKRVLLFLLVLPVLFQMHVLFPNQKKGREVKEKNLANLIMKNRGKFAPRVLMATKEIPSNALWKYGIESITGRAPLLPKRLVRFLSGPKSEFYWIESYPRIDPKPASPLSLVSAPIVVSTEEIQSPFLKPIGSGGSFKLYRDRSAFPKFRFYGDVLTVSDYDQSLDTLWKGANPFEQVWVESKTKIPSSSESEAECILKKRSSGFWRIDCRSTGNGVLWISQIYYPFWKVKVDGLDAELMPAHSLFQAVSLSKGTHRVELRYAPWHLPWTIFLSLGIFLLFSWVTYRSFGQEIFRWIHRTRRMS